MWPPPKIPETNRFIVYGGTGRLDPRPDNRIGFFDDPDEAQKAMQRFLSEPPLHAGEARWAWIVDSESGEAASSFAARGDPITDL